MAVRRMPRWRQPEMAEPGVIRSALLGADALPEIEAISLRAFDPRYGEAWNKAQCLSVLALPGYRLRGAWIDAAGQGDAPGAGVALAGFSIDRTVLDESELLLIGVDPAARRQGVGAHLLDVWLNSAREAGVRRAFLEMRQDNPAAALYRQYRFNQIAVRKAYYRGNDGVMRDAVTMERDTCLP